METKEPTDYLDEARMLAAQCWCDDDTSNRVMDVVLAEAVARRTADVMSTAAQHLQLARSYRDVLDQCAALVQVDPLRLTVDPPREVGGVRMANTRSLILTALLLALPALTHAQVTPAARILWDMPATITTTADALSYEPRLHLDGQPAPATALASVTCAAGTPVACEAPISLSNRDAMNVPGNHIIDLRLWRLDIGEGPASAPFPFSAGVGAPLNLRLEPAP